MRTSNVLYNPVRVTAAGAAVMILITVVISVLALNYAHAQQEPSLAELALKANDLDGLPKISGSTLIKSGPILADDLSQPLNRSNSLGSLAAVRESLFQYVEAYGLGAVIWDGQYSAYVGNYLYRYSDPAQVVAVANEWTKSVLQQPQGKSLNINAQTPDRGVGGQAAMTMGSDGDAIYWFAAVKGRTLILLMVNGMPVPSTQKAFEALAARIQQR